MSRDTAAAAGVSGHQVVDLNNHRHTANWHQRLQRWRSVDIRRSLSNYDVIDDTTMTSYASCVRRFCREGVVFGATAAFVRGLRRSVAHSAALRRLLVMPDGLEHLATLISTHDDVMVRLEAIACVTNVCSDCVLVPLVLSHSVFSLLLLLSDSTSGCRHILEQCLGCLSNMAAYCDESDARHIISLFHTLSLCLVSARHSFLAHCQHPAVQAAASNALAIMLFHHRPPEGSWRRLRDITRNLVENHLCQRAPHEFVCLCVWAVCAAAVADTSAISRAVVESDIEGAKIESHSPSDAQSLSLCVSRMCVDDLGSDKAALINDLVADLARSLLDLLISLVNCLGSTQQSSSKNNEKMDNSERETNAYCGYDNFTSLIGAATYILRSIYCLSRSPLGGATVLNDGRILSLLCSLLSCGSRHLRVESLSLVAVLLYSQEIDAKRMELATHLASLLDQVYHSDVRPFCV